VDRLEKAWKDPKLDRLWQAGIFQTCWFLWQQMAIVLFKVNLAGNATIFTAQFNFIVIFIAATSFSY
jgi:hypothetical protein